MDNLSDKYQRFIFNFIYIIFVYSLVYLFGIAIDLQIGIPMQLLLVTFLSLLTKYFIFNPLIFYVLLATSFIIALLVNHYIAPFLFPFMDSTYNLFSNIILNLRGKEKILPENILVYWILLVLIISIFTVFVLFKIKRTYLLFPVYFSVYLYYWYNFYDQAFWMISIFLIAYFILTGLIKYFREINKLDPSLKDSFEKLYSPWLKTSYSYALLIIAISLLLPKGYNYIRWPWLQNKVYTAFPIVEELRSYNHYSRGAGEASFFDFTTTGFQESVSRLGGPVQLSNKKIMTIKAKNSNYLRGNIKQIYTGTHWEAMDSSWVNYTLMQDFSDVTREEMDLFFEEEDITITNHNFATTTLFSPYMPKLVNLLENSWISVGNDYTLHLSRGIYDNENYLIRTLKPLPYGKLISLGIDNSKNSINNIANYLQLPDSITTRTKNLVKEIVKDKESDFEKAKAIEDYLRNNFEYNLQVSEVPETSEFVDYFLFDEQEGYCTYFATALAIMLRLEGIPTRYVEGFLAHNMVEPGEYEVRYENAHAWVEAFIEPVGWMTFEATPEFPVEDRMEDYEEVVVDKAVNVDNENIESSHPRGINDDPDMDFEMEIGVGDSNLDRENPYEDVTDLSKNGLLIFLGVLFSIIPIKFIISFIRLQRIESMAKRFSNNKRIIYLYNQIVRLLVPLGFPQLYGETHYEYARRIAYKFYDHDKVGIKEITDLFVKSKYSKYEASDEEVSILEDYKSGLEKRLKHSMGKRAYYFNKYLRHKDNTL